jgi:hypothetical protein
MTCNFEIKVQIPPETKNKGTHSTSSTEETKDVHLRQDSSSTTEETKN